MNKITTKFNFFFLLMFLSWGTQAELGYQEFRHIHINGTHLEDVQILELDQMLGYEVPNGFYWVNENTSEWGYEGNPEVLGSIYSANDPRAMAGEQSEQTDQLSGGSDRPYIDNDTGTGGGIINPGGCSYVSVGGTTVKSCD